jgi:hypothetical protein
MTNPQPPDADAGPPRALSPELPRDYMARCAQHGTRAIFQYRDDLIAGIEHLRFIGAEFVGHDTARRWDDRPGNLSGWWAFPSWEAAEAWLFQAENAGA